MARPRLPPAKAKVLGADVKHKPRFDGRNAPEVKGGIGDPFTWLNDKAQQAWREIVSEVPWLNESHRGFLAIAANIRGRMINGDDVGVQAMNLLRQCYGQMGATPADSTKIGITPDGSEKEPGEEFFDR
ncbi:hypothetical protein FJ959_08935 [Mesorhizobium sp. B2-2-4]|uniref:hypothetical protein n=1 Tax=unclassified Mesorhizobium TaxID=325217 RepID=UPI00112B2796|nr:MULTISPECIES: hypothetical protein [unclassified Mesorhizobium]TPM58989.1 hypothetical protein FJ959_08935 [Mesorhizobium sp. B2-2-4]TPM67474.1 hypothetical protein FJ965_10075 [Mesorhizobium sp. B2-2-1]